MSVEFEGRERGTRKGTGLYSILFYSTYSYYSETQSNGANNKSHEDLQIEADSPDEIGTIERRLSDSQAVAFFFIFIRCYAWLCYATFMEQLSRLLYAMQCHANICRTNEVE